MTGAEAMNEFERHTNRQVNDWHGYRERAVPGEPTETVSVPPTRPCPGCETKGLPEMFEFGEIFGKRQEETS